MDIFRAQQASLLRPPPLLAAGAGPVGKVGHAGTNSNIPQSATATGLTEEHAPIIGNKANLTSFSIALRSETVEALKQLRLRAAIFSSVRQRPMMASGRPQGSIQKVITTLEFLSVCSGPVRDIFAYWDRRREGRRMPSRIDINPADFAGHRPGIVFVEVRRDPIDYVYRSVGAREIEARGVDPTGKRVAEYWHGGGGMEAVLGNYNYVTTQGACLYEFERFIGRSGNYVIDETLFMPLSPDERIVTDILTYTHYEDIWRKSWP